MPVGKFRTARTPVLQEVHAIQIPPAGYAQQGMQVAPRLDKQTDGDLNSLLKATNDNETPIISTLSSMTDEALISWRSPENNDLSTTLPDKKKGARFRLDEQRES